MKIQKGSSARAEQRTTGHLLIHGRVGWVAGMRWTQSATGTSILSRLRLADTHFLVSGVGTDRIIGLVSPGKHSRRVRLYSLAAAFQSGVGGSSHGIYRINDQMWVFLATVRGRLTVMGDVTGSLNDVCLARSQFLNFNDPGSEGWNSVAEPEQNISWQVLVDGLSRRHFGRACLRNVSLRKPVLMLLASLAIILTALWLQNSASQRARDAAIRAAQQASKVIVKQPDARIKAPHPWAVQTVIPAFLSQCWFTREPLPVSVAGWRLSAGACDERGLRLHYEAIPGSTVEDFDQRARDLFGRPASFNLKEGGKKGDVFIPFTVQDTVLRDEDVASVDDQLKTFISHLQRRNVPVQFSEVKPAEVAPGAVSTQPEQDWREFSFFVSSRLAPEWLLDGCEDSGLRLSSIAFTLSAQGQFAYTIRGSLYAHQ